LQVKAWIGRYIYLGGRSKGTEGIGNKAVKEIKEYGSGEGQEFV
jgi:hypothetical protein